jgi:hypothetical protein
MPSDPPAGAVPPGESKNIHEAGGRYISIIASNVHFHLESDRWPHSVDVEAVAAFSEAVAQMTLRLARPDPFAPPKRKRAPRTSAVS